MECQRSRWGVQEHGTRLIRSVCRSVHAGGTEKRPRMRPIQKNAVKYGTRELREELLCCPSSQGESKSILADRVQSSFAQKRILCVDDNVLELTLRGKILELQGYSVVLLSCPIQALRCGLSTVDLAVLDFDMPGMNGRDLVLRMRALHARFPILLLSGSVSTLVSREPCSVFQMFPQG
jgi:CheY-like chemotaxis protein